MVENDLPLTEWTGEEKFHVGWLEHESAPRKPREQRTAQHDQRAEHLCRSVAGLRAGQLNLYQLLHFFQRV